MQAIIRSCVLASVILVCVQSGAAPAAPATPSADGAHDFDFLIGDWKAHLRRMVDRETGVTTSDPRTGTWVEYDGICNDKKLLDTNANFEQFDVHASGTHPLFRGRRFGCTIRHRTSGAFMGSTLIRASWIFRRSLVSLPASAANSSIPIAQRPHGSGSLCLDESRQSRRVWSNPFRPMAARAGL